MIMQFEVVDFSIAIFDRQFAKDRNPLRKSAEKASILCWGAHQHGKTIAKPQRCYGFGKGCRVCPPGMVVPSLRSAELLDTNLLKARYPFRIQLASTTEQGDLLHYEYPYLSFDPIEPLPHVFGVPDDLWGSREDSKTIKARKAGQVEFDL